MKKLITLLMLVGIILGKGINFAPVEAAANDYTEIDEVLPLR